jgi:hypothetical protein
MVNEINKIVYNLLISNREVCIGGVGTLFIVNYAAYRTTNKSITPPYRIVAFTSEERGVSLEEQIAQIAGVDELKAHELFDGWLSAVVEGDALKIEGVGVLRNDKFVAEEDFVAALNPLGRTPLRLKPKANVGLYVFASLCLLFAVAVAGYLYLDNNDVSLLGGRDDVVAEKMIAEVVEPKEDVASEVVDSVKVEMSQIEAQSEVAVADPQVAQPQTERIVDDEILSTISGRSYVVLGVFSTCENAMRATAQAHKKNGSLHCSIYHYGNKFMVALYDAPTRSECGEFVRSLDGEFKDLWIYPRK